MEPSHRSVYLNPSAVLLWALLLVCLAVAPRSAWSQTPELQQFRILDEPFRLALDEQPASKQALFDYGGWFRSSYFVTDENNDRDFDGHNDGTRAFRQQQSRFWSSLTLHQTHQFYVRLKTDYIDWNGDTSYDGRNSDLLGPNLERFWYNFRLSKAQWVTGYTPGDFDLDFKIGRDYVELGNGLSLSSPLDAAMLTTYYKDIRVLTFGALSIPSSNNIDSSVPDNPNESRRFGGVQFNFDHWSEQQPFMYYYIQEDQDYGMVRDFQSYGYDSQYLGLGSRGRFFHRDLQYGCELVSEFGKSHAWTDDEPAPQTIQAWAFDTELRYLIPDQAKSQLSAEYIFASGDGDRTYSPTNTIGGNAPHTKDTSFNAWGYRNTGLVLAPEISNIHIIRVGAATFPLYQVAQCDKLRVGTDVFCYHKQHSDGAMSDGLSYLQEGYVGSEWDVYFDWRLTSDLSLTLRYGYFLPGDAFASDHDRQLVFTGVTLNF